MQKASHCVSLDMRTVVCIILGCLLVITSVKTHANRWHDLPDFAHYTVITNEQVSGSWVLPLGKYQRAGGKWRLTEQQRQQGTVTKLTFRLPDDRNDGEWRLLLDEWVDRHSKVRRYSCQGRDCGTSHQWANTHFKIRELYGIEKEQAYWAFTTKSTTDQPQAHVAMYLAKRGNGQQWLQLEWFYPDP